ncbi:MAG: nitroreductase family protein [Spirochaetaceae bacterium]|nr:nitroreductase family protein [Spirochaetaceae bacterium]
MFSELIRKNRTKRIFNGTSVSFDLLEELIEDCRFSASTYNRQSIRYILINNDRICSDIFKITNLPSTHKVPIQNKPGAFVVMVVDREINLPESFLYYNLGIATANLTLSAASKGYSCATLLSTNFEKLSKILSLSKEKRAVSIIAVGMSDQKVLTTDIKEGDTSYYKEGTTHVVPKLTVESLIYRKI